MNDDYFEGILQLRNPSREVEDYILNSVEKKKNVRISDIKRVRGGLDFYFSSNKHIFRLGGELQNRFGGILKTSAKLHTRNKQTSKEVHRVNVLFRIMDYKKGDVVKIDEEVIKIKSMTKNITGRRLSDDKKLMFSYDAHIEVLKRFKTIVSKIKPDLEVLHPETFQSVPVINERKLSVGEKVKVVIFKGSIYLV